MTEDAGRPRRIPYEMPEAMRVGLGQLLSRRPWGTVTITRRGSSLRVRLLLPERARTYIVERDGKWLPVDG